MQVRVFKVGQRIALRGLELQDNGTITKIGRLRATVKLDTPFSTTDAIGRKKQLRKTDPAFEYKNLRILPDSAA